MAGTVELVPVPKNVSSRGMSAPCGSRENVAAVEQVVEYLQCFLKDHRRRAHFVQACVCPLICCYTFFEYLVLLIAEYVLQL